MQGSKCLLAAGYENAGAELALILLDVLNETAHEFDYELKNIISDVEKTFPARSPHRIEFLKGNKYTVLDIFQ